MGEAADDAIDRGMDEWLSGEWDEEGYCAIHTQTCRYCGAIDLQWGQEKGKWRLFDADGKMHACNLPAKKVFG